MPRLNNLLLALALPGASILVSCGTTKAPVKKPPQAGGTVSQETFSCTRIRTSEPLVALTFDDGPSILNTPGLLDILKEKEVRATFFMVGKNIATHPDIARQATANGHEIGSHSWSHPHLGKLSDAAVTEELQKTEDALMAATGGKPRHLRPPYGDFTNAQRQWVHRKFGYDFIFWDVDPEDWRKPGVDAIISRIVTGARNGSIILLHDIHADSVAAVPAIIDQLKAKGFKFLTVSELLAAEK
jgi:peptidoglycan/xylan/chitin deacetylase (PgdA/CDA1 family)